MGSQQPEEGEGGWIIVPLNAGQQMLPWLYMVSGGGLGVIPRNWSQSGIWSLEPHSMK